MDPFQMYKHPTERQERKVDFKAVPYCRKVDTEIEEYEKDNPGVSIELSHPVRILNLIKNLTGATTNEIEKKINLYLKEECDCSDIFYIHLIKSSEQARVNVVTDRVLDKPIIHLVSAGAINNLLTFKCAHFKCAEPILHRKLNAVIEEVVNKKNEYIIAVPIVHLDRLKIDEKDTALRMYGAPIGLLCCVNSKRDEHFVTRFVQETFQFCITILVNTFEYEEQARLKKQCQSLLNIARKLFIHLDDLDGLLKEIMSEAKKLTNSERCSLFLLDDEHKNLVARVFDGETSKGIMEVRIRKDQGIAGHVLQTGKSLVIKDAYSHPLFYRQLDKLTGFKTRNILCFPIHDEKEIVGVAQLCNKKDGHYDGFDEELADAFGIYCGLSIMHSLCFKNIAETEARNKLANEIMTYHMQVSRDDIAQIICCVNPHLIEDFDSFDYIPRRTPTRETPCYVLKMFNDVGFIDLFDIKKEVLVKFILFIRKGYRDMPYHNWEHAFSTIHFGYLCVKHFQIIDKGFLTELETLTYLIACLCHDLDHRGTTNSFQLQSNSVLASLYSSEGSVLERHHLSQTIATLNTMGCNFLEPLQRDEYRLCLDLLKDLILATDLANHFKIVIRQQRIGVFGYRNKSPEHRHDLACLLMTCADLSDQTKSWVHTKNVALLIYEEFFKQGDMESKMGREPGPMMDRNQANIPQLQVDFLTEVCVPCFRALVGIFPEADPLLTNIDRNIAIWHFSKGIFDRMVAALEQTHMDILASEEFEEELTSLAPQVEKFYDDKEAEPTE